MKKTDRKVGEATEIAVVESLGTADILKQKANIVRNIKINRKKPSVHEAEFGQTGETKCYSSSA